MPHLQGDRRVPRLEGTLDLEGARFVERRHRTVGAREGTRSGKLTGALHYQVDGEHHPDDDPDLPGVTGDQTTHGLAGGLGALTQSHDQTHREEHRRWVITKSRAKATPRRWPRKHRRSSAAMHGHRTRTTHPWVQKRARRPGGCVETLAATAKYRRSPLGHSITKSEQSDSLRHQPWTVGVFSCGVVCGRLVHSVRIRRSLFSTSFSLPYVQS